MRPATSCVFLVLSGIALSAGLSACAEGVNGPDVGVLRVTVETVGSPVDPDGYTVTLDDSLAKSVAANGVVDFVVGVGVHRVAVTGAAPNCRIGGAFQVVEYDAAAIRDTVTRRVDVDCISALPDRLDDVIVFVAGEDSAADVFAIRPDGTGLVNVTHDWEANLSPAVSPDGRRIAWVDDLVVTCYAWGLCVKGAGALWIMNADRTTRTHVRGQWGYDPAWSPDGLRIAMTKRAGIDVCDIGVGNADGSNWITLSVPDGRLSSGSPRWSPDGSRIVFSNTCDVMGLGLLVSPGNIYVATIDGTAAVQLTFDSTTDYQPAWSPDATRIAFTRVTVAWGSGSIYVMRSDGTDLAAITPDSAYGGSSPVWSPDGSVIAFVRTVNSPAVGGPVYSRILVIRSDGTDLTAITPDSMESFSPAWSHDGSRIAFLRRERRGGPTDVYVMDRDGSNARKLASNVNVAGGLLWAPPVSGGLRGSTWRGPHDRALGDPPGRRAPP